MTLLVALGVSACTDDSVVLLDTGAPDQSLRHPITQQVTDDYLEWERERARLSDEELARRERLNAQAHDELERLNEYIQWEAHKADQAEEELARRAALHDRALEIAADAAAAHEAALAREAELTAGGATDAELAEAQDEVARTAQLRQIADDQAVSTEVGVQQAVAAAVTSAQRQLELEQEAIAARYAHHDDEMGEALGVRTIPPKSMWTLVAATLRAGPGAGYTKTGEFPAGTEVRVDGDAVGFYRLTNGSFIAKQLVAESSAASAKPGDAVAETVSPYAWETYVANIDGQAAVDECTGGLTYSPELSEFLEKEYYPIHNYCQGLPILDLENGDLVNIRGVGVFRVVASKDVTKQEPARVVKSLPGTIILQTCYDLGDLMRAVALEPV